MSTHEPVCNDLTGPVRRQYVTTDALNVIIKQMKYDNKHISYTIRQMKRRSWVGSSRCRRK